jgi:5'-deoxynucleotidase YfbR-like HD superfamily hydrolase
MKEPEYHLDPRLAGEVVRYHTWPHIKAQTVAAHSWHVIRILLAIWPEVPRHVIVEAIFHDVGEGFAGDSPFYAKRANPGLKTILDKMENDARLGMALPWGVVAPQALSDDEYKVLKVADLIEMWEHALHEIELGNVYGYKVRENIDNALVGILLSHTIFENVIRYQAKRLDAHNKRMTHGQVSLPQVPSNSGK